MWNTKTIAAVSLALLSSLLVQAGDDVCDGCALETVDVKTGARTVVKSFARKIEAPNWTRDGRHLIYNSGGRLWRVPAAGGEEEPVDTGFCTRCNNDHVLSFDGKYVAVSHDEKGVPGLCDPARRKRRAAACHPQHALLSPRMESGRKDVCVLRDARRRS